MSFFAVSELVLSVVTALLLVVAAIRVYDTRAYVASKHLVAICSVTAAIVLFRSFATILTMTDILPDATTLAALPIRFVLLGTAAYIASLGNGHNRKDH